jgi:hypothetical protein
MAPTRREGGKDSEVADGEEGDRIGENVMIMVTRVKEADYCFLKTM